MQGWIEGFQESIDFIEQNLTEELDTADIAAKAALSPFYYQRIFGALCGMTVGEYIRARRMTLAAQELSREDVKVIDVAIKYGYESPDSFAKAFQKFHGITPSQAREAGAPLRSFAPLHIKITMEGGTMLDYRIVEKAPFTIVGTKRAISGFHWRLFQSLCILKNTDIRRMNRYVVNRAFRPGLTLFAL
jgi:AraC family transcriptional regulator